MIMVYRFLPGLILNKIFCLGVCTFAVVTSQQSYFTDASETFVFEIL